MSADRMTCMSCGEVKQYPDGFPDRAFAECWRCAWNGHIRNEHPEVMRRVRREVKKRAKRIVESDLRRAAVGNEVALLWPTPQPDATPDPVGETSESTTKERGDG